LIPGFYEASRIIRVQKPFLSISRGTGCSRSGVFWTRSQDGEGAKTRSEWSHDGETNVAEGICRFPARGLSKIQPEFSITGRDRSNN